MSRKGILEGRVAVVTGAARGIGLAIAERYAQEGAKRVMADLDARGLDASATRLRATGAEVARNEPIVFLETEMGIPCETLNAVRKQMDEALECKKSGRCSEGIQTVWRELPRPPGTPIS